MGIHPRSDIDSTAKIADDVEIGPGVVVGPNCVLKSGVKLGPNVILGQNTTLHEGVRAYVGAVFGTDPQDAKYDGSPTVCEIGPRTIVREYCTINRGTTASGATIVGADCMLMSYTHIGHDCRFGDRVVSASGVLIGGHCLVDDGAILGGNTSVHQQIRIGKLAMIGGASGLRQDAPPFMITAGGPPAKVYGVNSIGLRRAGITPVTRELIKQAFRFLYRSGMTISDALEKIERELPQEPEIKHLVEFIRTARRGTCRGSIEGRNGLDESDKEQLRNSVRLV
jgi:UDP-N-acetylglucosamine acyltransferase